MLIQAAISRSREFDADAGGASIAGSPNGLVSALRKIEAASRAVPLDANPATAHMFIIKPFSGAGLMGLFSTHPPTSERIQALLNSTHSNSRHSDAPLAGLKPGATPPYSSAPVAPAMSSRTVPPPRHNSLAQRRLK